jgi:hypothetical protein
MPTIGNWTLKKYHLLVECLQTKYQMQQKAPHEPITDKKLLKIYLITS